MRGIRQGISFDTLFLVLSVTIQIITSKCAAPARLWMNSLPRLAKNCAELYKSGQRISGVYKIDPDGSGAFDVYCDQTTAGGGWIVFQRRLDGSVDFNRTWDDYKHGFGNFIGELWLGLDKINRLTRNKTENMLRVDLGAPTGKTVHAEYSSFGIGNETAYYWLYVGHTTSATVYDSLGPHSGSFFRARGMVNSAPCINKPGGGWWYKGPYPYCSFHSNLNGIYSPCGKEMMAYSIYWSMLSAGPLVTNPSTPTWTEMKTRPVDF